jgi:hypothetical protein
MSQEHDITASTPLTPAQQVIYDLAQAVMRRGDHKVSLLNEDNTSRGWVPLHEAVTSGDAFFVRVRRAVIAFDGDTDTSDEAAVELVRHMEKEGLEPVAWRSGRPGHAQVIVVCPVAAQEPWCERARALGFSERPTATRPPLAPHRLGRPVSLMHPAEPAEAIRRLRRDARDMVGSRKLTPATMGLLRHSDPNDPSGSETVFRIMMGALAKGYAVAEVETRLADPANAGGESYRKRAAKNPAAAHNWL